MVQFTVFIWGHWTQHFSNIFNMFFFFILKQSISTVEVFFSVCLRVFKLTESFAVWIMLHLQKETLSFHLETTRLLGMFLDVKKKVSRSSTKCHVFRCNRHQKLPTGVKNVCGVRESAYTLTLCEPEPLRLTLQGVNHKFAVRKEKCQTVSNTVC